MRSSWFVLIAALFTGLQAVTILGGCTHSAGDNKVAPASSAPGTPAAPRSTKSNETTEAEFEHAPMIIRGEDLGLGTFVTDSTNPLACKSIIVTQHFADDRGVPELAVKLKDCPSTMDSKFGTDYDGEKNRIVFEVFGPEIYTPAFSDSLSMVLRIPNQDTIFAKSEWSESYKNYYDPPDFTVIAKYHRVK